MLNGSKHHQVELPKEVHSATTRRRPWVICRRGTTATCRLSTLSRAATAIFSVRHNMIDKNTKPDPTRPDPSAVLGGACDSTFIIIK